MNTSSSDREKMHTKHTIDSNQLQLCKMFSTASKRERSFITISGQPLIGMIPCIPALQHSYKKRDDTQWFKLLLV